MSRGSFGPQPARAMHRRTGHGILPSARRRRVARQRASRSAPKRGRIGFTASDRGPKWFRTLGQTIVAWPHRCPPRWSEVRDSPLGACNIPCAIQSFPVENEWGTTHAPAVLWILRAYSSTVRAEDSEVGRWRGNPPVVRCKFGERPARQGRPNAEPSPREGAVRCRDHNHPPKPKAVW